MANTKISQLPEYTGNTYNGYFVWNDSGETQTYKIKQTNSFVNRLEVFRNTGNTNNISNELGVIIIGRNNTSSQDKYNLILGEDNNVNGVGAPGSQGSVVNGLGNTVGTFGYGSLVFGGYNNIQAPGNLVFGNNGSVSGGGNLSRGEQNNITGGVNVAWGDYITINCNYAQSFGLNNDITTTTAYQGIYGGENNLISSTGGFNYMLGGSGNTISGSTSGSTLIGLNNYTQPTKNNTTYVNNFNVIGGSFEVGSGNTISSVVKNVGVIGNDNNIEGLAGGAQMYIGNGFSSSAFGNYALHIGNGHYASGSYNISVGDNTIEQNASYSLCIGNSGGSQQHKQWGTDVYNLGVSNQLQGLTGGFAFGKNHTISNGQWGGIFAGIGNSMSSSGNYNTIIGGENNSITGGTNVAMIGCSGRTATTSVATFVENLVVFNYAGLNFADDTAAAAGGVVLGQIYHTGGTMKIRIV